MNILKSLSIAASSLSLCASAWGAALPPLPDSPWADTEISTNVAFNAERSDAREFGVEMSFTGTASNCLQVAFGRDADGDGDLSPEETAMLLGWRAGSYFIEDAVGCVRYAEEAVSPSTSRLLSFRVALDGAFRPRAVAATNEAGACFPALAGAAPAWLYGADCLSDISRDFDETLPQCQQITLEECTSLPWHKRLVQALLRLLATLM